MLQRTPFAAHLLPMICVCTTESIKNEAPSENAFTRNQRVNTRDVCLITRTLMSNILPPLLIPVADRDSTASVSTISLPPLSTWSESYPAFSSPPPPSSSPPMTPFSLESHVYTRVKSSPGIASEHEHYAQPDHSDNPPSTWDRNNVQYPAAKFSATGHSLPGFKSTFASQRFFPSSSRHDASVLYDGESTRFHENRSYNPGDVTARYPDVFYDSEEESYDEGIGFSSEGDTRATFFRTSAERGQWRHDPIPVRPHPRQQMRKSIASWSPPALSNRQHAPRPISEPAPSTSRPLFPAAVSDEHDENEDVSELPFAFPTHALPSDHQNMMCDARQSLPSLMSDRDTSPEQEEMHLSSPLPPSSPPLSYMSYPHSPMARSISPLSFAPSSPPPVSSSPLMFSSSVDHDDDVDQDDESGTTHVSADCSEALALTASESPDALILETDQEMMNPPTTAHDTDSEAPSAPVFATNSPLPAPVVMTQSIPVTLEGTSNSPPIPVVTHDPVPEAISLFDVSRNCKSELADGAPEVVRTIPEQMVEVAATNNDKASIEEVDPGVTNSDNLDIEVDVWSAKLKGQVMTTDDPIASHYQDVAIPDVTEESSDVKVDATKEKRKKQKEESRHDGPPRKKARVKAPEKLQAAKLDEKRMSEDEEPDVAGSAPRAKNQKKSGKRFSSGKRARQTSHSRSDASASTSKLPHSSDQISSPKSKEQDTDMSELDAEITGMLIECMATSRASSLSISSLCKSVMGCRPSLKAQRSEKEWATVFRRVLRNGTTGSGVFGKVESSGKDDSDRPLEAQWFYVPERDSDQERAMLIRSMMPRPGKRSETKKYKQYYYRPLEKISRWDGEDDI